MDTELIKKFILDFLKHYISEEKLYKYINDY